MSAPYMQVQTLDVLNMYPVDHELYKPFRTAPHLSTNYCIFLQKIFIENSSGFETFQDYLRVFARVDLFFVIKIIDNKEYWHENDFPDIVNLGKQSNLYVLSCTSYT